MRAALAAGAKTINIPDTVGYALPHHVADLFLYLRGAVPELEGAVLSFHGQNDLGMASANAIAAVTAGARQVELCVNGIGERAGNTSFEEVVMAIAVHRESLGVHTDVDTRGIYPLSQLVQERSGIPVTANKAIVGRNAFRHASGIHQDGVLKHRLNFECIDPADIGHPTGTENRPRKALGNGWLRGQGPGPRDRPPRPSAPAGLRRLPGRRRQAARHLGRGASRHLRQGVRVGSPAMTSRSS